MKNLRSLVVRLVVVSFSLAALLGIITLLAADALGDTGSRVLFTTFVVGVESLAVLCYLAVAGTRRSLMGVAGGAISLVPFAIVLWIIWSETFESDWVWRTFGISLTLAASLAQACLLAAVADKPRPRVSPMLTATFAAIVVLAAMIIYPISTQAEPSGWYWRILGIVAILDVLGTILVIALQKFAGTDNTRHHGSPMLSAATEARLVEAARLRGTTPAALLDELLDDLTNGSPAGTES